MLDLDASLRAISMVACRAASGATTWLTSPMSAARLAGVISPVSSISIACLLATFRDKATIGVDEAGPLLGLQNVDFDAVGECVGDEAIAVRPMLHPFQICRID